MRSAKLLVLGPLPPPAGGVETVIKAVLESRVFDGFQVRHCDLTKRRPKETQGVFDFRNLLWAVIHFKRMIVRMISFRPDIVYMPVTATWSGFFRDGVLAIIARLGGAILVGHVHGAWFDRILAPRGLVGWTVRLCLGRYHALLLLGDMWRQQLLDYGYGGRTFIVPSMLGRLTYDAGLAVERDYDRGPDVALFVGQVGRRKGLLDLLDAWVPVQQRVGRLKLVVVGGPEFQGEWETVMTRYEALGLAELVEFTGPLEGEALHQRFCEADFFLLPSYSEGLPVVLFEAGAFGLPVITTPVGSVPELIRHGENGLVVEPGDVEGILRAVEKVCGDPAQRRRLGSVLRKDIGRYHPDSVCERILEAIDITRQAKCRKAGDVSVVERL